MKSGEAGFRHSHPPKATRPVIAKIEASGPSNKKTTGPSKRAQRRFEESEERRRLRRERKRERAGKK
jgi:hypothetical protein